MTVTLYSRGQDGNNVIWDKRVFKKTRVTERRRSNTNISVKGVVPNSEVIMRIMTRDFIPLKTGDRIYLGAADAALPPKDCLTVREVSDCRRKSRFLKHWKVVC